MIKYICKHFFVLTLKVLILSMMLGIYRVNFTNAYFSSRATVAGNTFSKSIWETDPKSKIVINEVYYDVAGDKGTENKNEWIELYNAFNTPVSLKNWKLVDGGGNTKDINPEVSIPAFGFAVLSHDNSTWSSYWSLPKEAVTINLTGSKSWLNNNGDKLILKDYENNEVDWVAWENYVSGWNLNANEGQSIARKTKGVDTDSPADWEILSIPNPGTNPHSSSIEDSPKLYLTFSDDKRSVSFKVSNIKNFTKLSYQITYDSDTISDGIQGLVDLSGADTFSSDNLTLGTCSSGGTCVYYSNVKNIHLQITLEGSGVGPDILEKLIP